MLGFQKSVSLSLFFFCVLFVSADPPPTETDVSSQDPDTFHHDLRFVRANPAPNPKSPKSKKNPSKTTMFPKNATLAVVTAARFNILAVGGTLNMVFSLINLIFGLFNFYLLYGRYDLRLRQIRAKVKVAVEEMASRDMHPKIKMSLSRTFPPEGTLFPEVMSLLSQPSPLFDHTNNLLDGQKEARLRKVTKVPQEAGSQKTPSKEGKKTK